jgi:hypothetical protein
MERRRVKIQPKYVTKSNYNSYYQVNVVPELRISGKWLEKNGFHPNEKVSIIVEFGKLIIQNQ